MIQYVKWDVDYSIGISVFDEQHKKIIELLNQLLDTIKKDGKMENFRTILNVLISHTALHFETEENAMKKFNFPQYKKHREEHGEIKLKLSELHKKSLNGDKPGTMETLKFITYWIDKHLKGIDVNYGPFLISKGWQ